MNWGDTWWVETEHAGRRPAAIITRPEAIPILPVVLVAFATTTVRGLDTEVLLDESDGMLKRCVLNLDTPELVSKAMLTQQIGQLSVDRMRDVCDALAAAVNCPQSTTQR